MIIRISRGRVRPGTEAEVFGRLRAATEGRERPGGLAALFVGRHLTVDGIEIVAITVWTDVGALIGVLGSGWESPKWLGGVEELITHSAVEHLETAIEDFDRLERLAPVPAGSEGN